MTAQLPATPDDPATTARGDVAAFAAEVERRLVAQLVPGEPSSWRPGIGAAIRVMRQVLAALPSATQPAGGTTTVECARLPNDSNDTCLTEGCNYGESCDVCRAIGWPTTVEWQDTLRNDGHHEYTETGDCHGTWTQAFRRSPGTSTQPTAWEKVDAIPDDAAYPASTGDGADHG